LLVLAYTYLIITQGRHKINSVKSFYVQYVADVFKVTASWKNAVIPLIKHFSSLVITCKVG